MTIQPSDSILIVDFGSQVTQLIARRVREAGVYSEIAPFNAAEAAFERMKPKGVWADVFRTRFRIACQRLGLNREMPALDCSQFVPPSADGQLALF